MDLVKCNPPVKSPAALAVKSRMTGSVTGWHDAIEGHCDILVGRLSRGEGGGKGSLVPLTPPVTTK